MVDFSSFNSIIALTFHFNLNERCTAAIVESRWPDGDVVCPYCGGHHCVTRKYGKFRSYIDEAVFRWNTRKMDESERFAHMFCKSIGLVRKWSDIRVRMMAA